MIYRTLVILSLLLLTSCPSKSGKTTASVIPPNPPNKICPIHGKWTHTPTVFIEPVKFNGFDAEALCTEVIDDMNKKYDFKMQIVKVTDNSGNLVDVNIQFYNNPWTSKAASSVDNTFKCGSFVYGTKRMNNTSFTTYADMFQREGWYAPLPATNYAGLTYSRTDNDGSKQECLLWMNAYFLTDGKGYPTSFKRILRHELGHVLGLDHAAVDTALMYPSASKVNDFCPEEKTLIDWLY